MKKRLSFLVLAFLVVFLVGQALGDGYIFYEDWSNSPVGSLSEGYFEGLSCKWIAWPSGSAECYVLSNKRVRVWATEGGEAEIYTMDWVCEPPFPCQWRHLWPAVRLLEDTTISFDVGGVVTISDPDYTENTLVALEVAIGGFGYYKMLSYVISYTGTLPSYYSHILLGPGQWTRNLYQDCVLGWAKDGLDFEEYYRRGYNHVVGIFIKAKSSGGASAWGELGTVSIITESEAPPTIQKMIRPVEGYVTSYFGWRMLNGIPDYHEAIDIAGLTQDAILGEVIVAPARGIVDGVGVTTKGGNWIRIKHDVSIEKIDQSVVSDVFTSYSHLLFKPSLEQGEPVKQGYPIGQVGKSGTKFAHLHFVVRESWDNKVNPLGYVDYSPKPGKGLKVEARSPLDISIMDPDGYRVSKNLIEIEETATYLEEDFDGDGDVDDRIWITDRKLGNYTITVVPQPNALPGDTYSLEVTADEQTIILAENVLISNIPDEPYIIRSTETEIIAIIPATINFEPDTLNLKSKGEWITVYIELPVGHGYALGDVDIDSILLEGLLEVEHSDVQDGVLMVKFDMQDLIIFLESVVGVIPPDAIPLTVIGQLADGTRFEGSDTIRVIDKGGKKE